MSDPQQHPGYHEGFYDAQAGEPIWFVECSREYALGWTAFWELAAAISSPSSPMTPGAER